MPPFLRLDSIMPEKGNYVPGLKVELIELLWKGTKEIDGHWRWWSTDHRIMINGRRMIVHRLSLCIYTGLDYYDDFFACHLCQVKDCWNPLHLYKGDNSSNMIDAVRDGTHSEARRTHCPKGHLLNGLRGNGKRYCKVCNYLRVMSHA